MQFEEELTRRLLARTSATSSHTGFLKRSLERFPAVKVSTADGAASSTANDFMVLCPLDDHETGLVSGDVEGSRWNSRGWTLQERALSARLIHFCHNKLYFECRFGLLSEEGEPLDKGQDQVFRLWPLRAYGDVADAEPLLPASLYDRWQAVVSSYNGRNLTRDSDKLLAIRSIASEMEVTIPADAGRYIPFAGMWEADFSAQLLWQFLGAVRLPSETRAPSWSWASLNGVVSFKYGLHVDDTGVPPVLQDCLRVVDMGLLPSGTSGYLVLRSWVCSVSWIRYMEQTDYWKVVNRAGRNFDILTRVRGGEEGKGGNAGRVDGGEKEFLFAHGNLDVKEQGGSLLSLRDGELAYVHISNAQRASGLLLRRVVGVLQPGYRDCTWKRIGVATVFDTHTGCLFMPSLFENKSCMLQEVFIV